MTTSPVDRMKFGFVGSFGSVTEQIALAEAAERGGWDGWFTWDAVSLGTEPTWDPFALLAAVAMRTERIRLGALVFAVPRRLPWEFVQQAMTVDQLSGGRLVLPIGVGVLDDAAAGGVTGRGAVPAGLADRAELLDETLSILTGAESGETFDHDGRHYQVRGLRYPAGGRHIPVWPVGVWPAPKSLRRVARADGIVVQLRGDRAMEAPAPQDIRDLVDRLTELRGGPDHMSGFDVVVQGEFPDRAQAIDLATAYAEAGVTWWIDARWEGEDSLPPRQLELVTQGPPRAG